ncbi:beta-amyrin 28-monooxygenase [Ranunculus cassubicifolius]
MEMRVLPSIIFSIFVVLLCAKIFIQKKSNKSKNNVPPGEMGLPWIGETYEFYKAQRKNRLFEEFLEPRKTKHGNIFKTRLMGSSTVVVNGANANRFFLSNEFKLVVSSWPSASVQLMGPNSIMEKQGDQHRCVRGLIAASLSSIALESLVPKICKSVDAHLNAHWKGQDRISLFRSTKVLTFSIVFECLLGIKVEVGMLEMFERVLEGVFALPVAFPGSKFWRAKKARLEIEDMLLNVVRKKRLEIQEKLGFEEEENGVLLSRLIVGMIRGEISEAEVIDNVVLLVFAAHDTTSFAIAMVCRLLAQNPNCYARLLQEHREVNDSKPAGEFLTLDDTKKMHYTWQVARESLRLFPPIFGSFRKAIVDIEYEGYIIPKGWKVLWMAYGSHYDEQYFPDPSNFDPSRFESTITPYAYVPFGGGPRICAGYQLAKFNILIFLHYMVTRYDWSLVHLNEPITMDPLPFPCHGMPINISPKL